MKKIALLTALLLLLSTTVAYAECALCQGVNSDDQVERFGFRLARGLTNTLLGWTELLFRPGKEVAKGKHFSEALLLGVGYSLGRTGSGIIDLLILPVNQEEDMTPIKDCPVCAARQ